MPGRYHKPLLIVLALVTVLILGVIRFLTGPEFAFSALFLLPIVTVTWLAGLRAGILLAIASALSWLQADLAMIDRFSRPCVPLINETFRLLVFVFIVFVITRYKENLETQKELAMMDPLTGVANRRAFLQMARTEMDRSRRYHHPFSVMVIDIDGFKQINDRFGHPEGDRLLTKVVETIKRSLRGIDIVARFGGDEFVVLLVKTGETHAAGVARKLQHQLLDSMRRNQWPVTFSIGLATYHSVPDNVEESINAADQLMYQVKRNGKNNIRHAVMEAEVPN